MANARQAALQERRSSSYGGGKIRVLAPAQTGLSSIAKQNAANESDVMISKYNNGLIGNAEMKSFLESQVQNPYVSQSDKTQIQTKLADFDVLIEKDRLESVFKTAPENSMAKSQAAQKLSQFYSQRASQMVPGTPAHSQAVENAGVWQQNVESINQNVNKLQRKNLENTKLQQINQLPTSSSERSQAQAQMYKQLYDMAQSQGDQEDAQVYAAKYEQAVTVAQQYAEQEQSKMDVNEIKQFAAQQDLEIAKLTDKTPDEMKAKAEKAYAVAEKYAAIGDQLNYTKYMTIGTQAEEKWSKKMAGLSAAETAKVAFQNEKDYSDNIRLAQERYVTGQFSPPFTSAEEEYKDSLSKSVSEWQGTLENIYNTAINMDASEKISWRGKARRVGDVLDEIQKEYDKIQGLDQAIESGAAMLKELPTSEKIGKNTPKFELIDVRNLSEEEQQLLIPDESGILHPGEMGKQEIDKETFNNLMLEDSFRKDLDYNSKTGKYYQDGGLQFSVIDPETGQKFVQRAGEDGKIKSAASIRDEATKLGVKPGEQIDFNPEKAAEINANQVSMTAEQVSKSLEKKKKTVEPPTPELSLIDKIAGATDQLLPKGKVTTPIPEKRTLGKQLTDTAQAVIENPLAAGKEILGNITQPKPAELKNTQETPVNINTNNQPGMTFSQPQQSKPTVNQPTPGLTYSTPAPKPVTYTPAPAVKINPVSQPGLTYSPAPKATPAPQPTTLQKIGTTITGAAGQAVNKLKKLFGW